MLETVKYRPTVRYPPFARVVAFDAVIGVAVSAAETARLGSPVLTNSAAHVWKFAAPVADNPEKDWNAVVCEAVVESKVPLRGTT
ncbi:MAG: hypothetical protein ABIR17_09090 [Pseudolysinimonas sp.]